MAQNGGEHWFSSIATQTANGSGRPWAFGLASAFVVGWLLTGPLFHFSDTWQLVMNTVSSIVTFLMVFLIQNTQNRESAALQLKLDELIRVTAARSKMMGIEQLSEPELKDVRRDMDKGTLRIRTNDVQSAKRWPLARAEDH
jgi:low affinity Fe/Cu permease